LALIESSKGLPCLRIWKQGYEFQIIRNLLDVPSRQLETDKSTKVQFRLEVLLIFFIHSEAEIFWAADKK
jgi:hypothetical protein